MNNLREVNDDILKDWLMFREEEISSLTCDEDKKHLIYFDEIAENILRNVPECNKKYVHFLTENGEVLLSFIDNGYVEFFMCIPYNIERKVQKESIEQYLKMLFSIKIEDK